MTGYWLLDHLGDPLPCAICGKPTPARELTGCWVPAIIVEMGPGVEIIPKTAVYVCPACPLPGEPVRR